MSSLIEELQRREAAARQEVDELRAEIARLNERLARAEEALSRLEITRETVAEILGGAGAEWPTAGQVAEAAAGPAPASSRLADGSPIGVMTVPPWRPGIALSVLPSSYRDLLEVLADTGRPLWAGSIAAAAGLATPGGARGPVTTEDITGHHPRDAGDALAGSAHAQRGRRSQRVAGTLAVLSRRAADLRGHRLEGHHDRDSADLDVRRPRADGKRDQWSTAGVCRATQAVGRTTCR